MIIKIDNNLCISFSEKGDSKEVTLHISKEILSYVHIVAQGAGIAGVSGPDVNFHLLDVVNEMNRNAVASANWARGK